MKQTLINLTKAFVGESQARNRYSFYAKIARKEGFEQIADIFLQTAEQEKTHAKRLFEHIQELKAKTKEKFDEIKIETTTPTVYGHTVDNLKAAIAGENHEYAQMYPEFANIARQEGLIKITARLRSIAIAEKHHRDRYEKLLKQVKAKTVFSKKTKIWWICRECGYEHFAKQPPVKCPACDHPKAFYQVKCDKY